MATQYAQVAVKASSRGFWGALKLLIRYSFWGVVVLILFAGSVAKGIEAKSFWVGASDLAGKVFLATTRADIASQDILASGWSWGSGMSLIGAVLVLYFWMKLFAGLYGRSPLSNQSNWFINWALSFITVTILLSVISLAHGAVTGNVTTYFGGETSAMHYLVTPFRAYGNIIKAMAKTVLPFSEVVENWVS